MAATWSTTRRRRRQLLQLSLLATDVVMVAAATVLASLARFGQVRHVQAIPSLDVNVQFADLSLVILVIWIGSLWFEGLYDVDRVFWGTGEYSRVARGLSLGVVVVEAALRSGSLITARLATEAGREVFAVPGSPLDPRARGANDLIREGAHLTEGLADILANLPDHPSREGLSRNPLFSRGDAPGLSAPPDLPPDPGLSTAEAASARETILAALSPAPTDVDDLIRRCQLPAPAVMAALLDLEIAGRIESLPGNRVARLA